MEKMKGKETNNRVDVSGGLSKAKAIFFFYGTDGKKLRIIVTGGASSGKLKMTCI